MTFIIENIKSRKQLTSYTCGIAVLRTIFLYYGKNVHEKTLVKKGSITSDLGTSHKQICYLANLYKFKGYSKRNSNIEEIEGWIRKNVPVIVNYQDGNNNGNNGHYSVVIGFNKRWLYLADPSNYYEGDYKKYSNVKRILKSVFLIRWWDIDSKYYIKENNNLSKEHIIKNWICVIRPKKNKK